MPGTTFGDDLFDPRDNWYGFESASEVPPEVVQRPIAQDETIVLEDSNDGQYKFDTTIDEFQDALGGNINESSENEYIRLFQEAARRATASYKDLGLASIGTLLGIASALVYYASAKAFGSNPDHTFATRYIPITAFATMYMIGTIGSNAFTAIPFLTDIMAYFRKIISASSEQQASKSDAEKSSTFYEIMMVVLASSSALSLALIGINPSDFGVLDIVFTFLGWIVFAAMNHFSLRGLSENIIPRLTSIVDALKQAVFGNANPDLTAIKKINDHIKKLLLDALGGNLNELLNNETIKQRYEKHPEIMKQITVTLANPSEENTKLLMNLLFSVHTLTLDKFFEKITSAAPFQSWFQVFWSNLTRKNVLVGSFKYTAILASGIATMISVLGYMISTGIKLNMFDQWFLGKVASLFGLIPGNKAASIATTVLLGPILYIFSAGMISFALIPFVLLMIQVAFLITGSLADTAIQAISGLLSVLKHTLQKAMNPLFKNHPGLHPLQELLDNIELMFPIEMRHNKVIWSTILAVCIFIACFSFSGANSLLETDFLQADFYQFASHPVLDSFLWWASAISTAEFNSYGFKELPRKIAAFLATFLATYFPSIAKLLVKVKLFNKTTVPDMFARYFSDSLTDLLGKMSPGHVSELAGQGNDPAMFKWFGCESVADKNGPVFKAQKLLMLALFSQYFLDSGAYGADVIEKIKKAERFAETYRTKRDAARERRDEALQIPNLSDEAKANIELTYQTEIATAIHQSGYLTELALALIDHLKTMDPEEYTNLTLKNADLSQILKRFAQTQMQEAEEAAQKPGYAQRAYKWAASCWSKDPANDEEEMLLGDDFGQANMYGATL